MFWNVLWIISFIFWIVSFIGYPIYKKVIKKEKFNWIVYALLLNSGALLMNLCTIIARLLVV